MGKLSWIRTVITQLSLCLAVFLAFNLGRPWEKPISHGISGSSSSRALDLYFISVRGGFRPLNQQTRLLKQMEKAAKLYKARFVINISELGEDDPLTQNGTWRFSTLKVPCTSVSRGQGMGYFLKQIKIPSGKTLDIIGLDTGALQDFMLMNPLNGAPNDQLHWLTKTLKKADSDWHIVVGFCLLAVCGENGKQIEIQLYEHLHHILYKFGVDAYLSGEGCNKDSIASIKNPGSIDDKLPLASVNGISGFSREMVNGFLLHRVSSLEIETYFVNSEGEVVHDLVLQQRGKAAM